MADFEGLINQALAKQNAADPAVRERVYLSSRKALVKMLEKTGSASDEAVRHHFEKLEASIARIESTYAPIEPAVVAEPPSEPAEQPAQNPPVEPEANAQQDPVSNSQPESDASPKPVSGPGSVTASPIVEIEPAPEAIPPAQAETEGQAPEEIPPFLGSTSAPSVEPAVASSQPSQNEFPPQLPEVPAATPPKEPPSPRQPADESEPDIIAELEALIPETYKPAPLFPPVEQDPSLQAEPQPQSVEPIEPTVSASVATANTQTETTAPINQVPPTPAPDIGPNPEPAFENKPKNPGSDSTVEAYLGEVADRVEPSQQQTVDDFSADRDEVRVYKRKNPLMRRIWPILLALAVVLVILWILYALFANMPSTNAPATGEAQVGAVGEVQEADDGSTLITLLEPTDLSALVTAGRGTAELVTQRNTQMLRVQSVRQGALTNGNAEPILLELGKGVLRQISGKEVTVEFYAQSGQSGPAQFAIECGFADDSICGRKRFRVGAQPERIVFALDLKGGVDENARAYLAINTDITNAADASGSGDAVDIIYVRLRLNDPNA